MIEFECPKCKHRLRARDSQGGSLQKCPSCKESLQVPTAQPQVELRGEGAHGAEVREINGETCEKKGKADSCPNCGEEFKNGYFSANSLLSASAIAIINEYHETASKYYCVKCGGDLSQKYSMKLAKEIEELSESINKVFAVIPIVSIHSPKDWDYSVCGLVTAQTTTGTGVVSEIASGITDFFGMQSEVYNEKLRHGEHICMQMLRRETLVKGGNAIVAADIDYASVGAGKGMLMVCMSGTAVDLKNPEILGESIVEDVDSLKKMNSRICHLKKLYNDARW